MNPPQPLRLRVAIVGAGLGGLLLALVLQKSCSDIDLHIYESAEQLNEIGAGIGVWPRTWEILRTLGLEDDLLEATGIRDKSTHWFRVRKGDEGQMFTIRDIDPKFHSFHRSHLLKIIFKHIQSAETILHFSKRLTSYTEPKPETERITLTFMDGTQVQCDLLVGCDGVRSAVRCTMYAGLADSTEGRRAQELRKLAEPVWSGTVAYRGLIPSAKLPEEVRQEASKVTIYVGKWKNVVCYPIARGEIINIVALVTTPDGEGSVYPEPWVSPVTPEEVVNDYSVWHPNLKRLFSYLENPSRWAVHTTAVLPTYVTGRVAILGDAAHSMTTHYASGAGQAMEDAFILGAMLAHPSVTTSTLPAALRIYDDLRRPISQEMLRRSRETGRLHQLLRLGWEDVSEAQSAAGEYPRELLTHVAESYDKEGIWVVADSESVMADRERALNLVGQLKA